MKHKVQAALSLSWSEWGVLIRGWLLLFFVDLALRSFSFTSVRRLLFRKNQNAGFCEESPAFSEALQIYRLVQIAARHHIYPMSCLRRALVLRRLLSDHGIVTELRFGVQKSADGLLAHAWVEYEGRPVVEGYFHPQGFAPMVAANVLSKNDTAFSI